METRRGTETGVLLALCVVALGLRTVGISYALPDILHPDTPKQLHRVPLFLQGHWVPSDAYPTVHMYGVALILKGLLLWDPHAYQIGPSITQVAVTARLLNALLSTATIPLVYLAGKWLLDRRSGLLAATLLSVSSLNVLHAHYEMGDVAQTFFVTASFAAAARILLTGRGGSFLVAGALAGLAAAAKYYGGIVGGAVAVAALGSVRPSPARRLGLLAAAGLVAAATFTLATPMFLFTPWQFIDDLPDTFGTAIRPPPLLMRPLVAARGLLGLSLEWWGILLLATALAGVGTLLARGWRGALVLSTPILVVGLYATARAHRLDDRTLLILAPFVAVSAAAALTWLGRHGRLGCVAGLVLGVAILGTATVDALHVALVFRQDDTRTLARRWADRHLPPSTKVLTDTYAATTAAYAATGADVLQLSSRDYTRHLSWYSLFRSDAVRDSLALLASQGKLLKRFELKPRAFNAPTMSYYDLGSMDVPYAFPPPEDVAGSAGLIFVDDAAVPGRASLVAEPGRTVTATLVSRTPLRRVWVALSGTGRVRLRHGWRTVRARLDPGDVRFVALEPRRSFPWFKYFYRVSVESRDGWVLARLLVTPCEVASAHLAYRQWAAALPHLEACRGTRWVEPARLLRLAWAHAELGDAEAARRALEELERAAPGLFAALSDLVRRPDGAAWRARYQTLAGVHRGFWHGHTFTMQAEATPVRPGAVIGDVDAREHRLVRAGSPETEAGFLKVWFPQEFLRGRYLVRFRLRGQPADGVPIATLDVVRHFQRRVHDVPARMEWRPRRADGAFEDVLLPVETEIEPLGFEARVYYHGQGVLEIDEISVLPDVRARLAEKIQGVGRVLGSTLPGTR